MGSYSSLQSARQYKFSMLDQVLSNQSRIETSGLEKSIDSNILVSLS